MNAQNIYPLSLNGDTFNALKSDYDQMLRQTLNKMDDLKVDEATITIKVAVSLEKDQARDFQANGYDAMRDIVKPTFKHEISTMMQVKDKKSGSLGGTMELVWDQETGQYVMRPIDNGQTTLFDQDDGGSNIVDADFTVVEDGKEALPGGPAALPSPQNDDDKTGDGSESNDDVFEYMRQFVGSELKVLEGLGQYTVRTMDNKVVLSSGFKATDRFYCSPEKLKPHVGHKIVCVGYGQDEIVNIAIECEDCNEVLFDVDAPKKDEPPEDYGYEDPKGDDEE